MTTPPPTPEREPAPPAAAPSPRRRGSDHDDRSAAAPRAGRSRPEHDDDLCDRIYRECKTSCVSFARRLLTVTGRRNGYLAAFDAEELYDIAWVTYYDRREYREHHGDHTRFLNALIVSRFRDEHRRSTAAKRMPPGVLLHVEDPVAQTAAVAADRGIERVVDRDELRRVLAQVSNPDDTRGLVEQEVLGLTFAEIGENEGITAEAARRRAERAKEQARRSVADE